MNSQIGDLIVKPLLVGSLAGLINNYQYPGIDLIIGTGKMSLAQVTFGAVFLGSLTAEILHDFVFPHIPKLDKLNNMTTEIVAVGTVFGSSVILQYLANARSIQEIGIGMIFIESAAAEVAGDYLYRNFVSGMLDSLF